MLKKIILFVSILFIATTAGVSQPLQTVAEKSHYTATSTFEDVMAFLHQLQAKSTEIRLTTIAVSAEGRPVVMAILGNPPPETPLQANVLKKPVVYAQANIHAGEVEGKEAMLALMRDILLGPRHALIENQIVLMVPNFNPDGNQKISRTHRTNQVGPLKGVGVRANGQGLDLNRDFVKLETPEVSGLVEKVWDKWDPILFVDMHTTNGSDHHEPLTWAGPHNPNMNPQIYAYVHARMLPAIRKKLLKEKGIASIPYGYFKDRTHPNAGWVTFDHKARYSTNYAGLRNRFSILDENYAYADYKTRVTVAYEFLREILQYTHDFGPEMQTLVRSVDQSTMAAGANPDTARYRFGTAIEALPFKEPLTIQGYEFSVTTDSAGKKRYRKLEKSKIYHPLFYGDFTVIKSVPIPRGYIIPSTLPKIIAKLEQHGIVVERLCAPVKLRVQKFQFHKLYPGKRPFQGHWLTRVTVSSAFETDTIPAGYYFVGMNQPLAPLIATLLEPESDDGLLVWNFFDRYLTAEWSRRLGDYPVFKVFDRAPALRKIVN
ncbi:MAG TPA: hypothetical protein ENH53_02690 [Bacteroidetes bacterium]|nr:hypothetical protein [Bacteroidota bacterium]